MALTSRPPTAGFPLTVEIAAAGLPKRSWVKVGQVRALALERIGGRLSRAQPDVLARVVEGLNEIIG